MLLTPYVFPSIDSTVPDMILEKRSMHIRDVDINVQITGSGVPLLWGHGLMSSMEAESDFDWLQWHTPPENIRLIRYDARGHGKSQISLTPEDYHWQNLGRDMLALADAVGETQFIAAGASMGCATAIYAALQAPERIKSLILVIPPTIWETRATQGQLYRRTATLGGMLGGDKLATLMGRNLARSMPAWMVESVPGVVERAARKMRAMHRQALWNLFRGAGRGLPDSCAATKSCASLGRNCFALCRRRVLEFF